MTEIQQDKFNEIIYFALEAFQAAHQYHPSIAQSYLNNFINHPYFRDKRTPSRFYEKAFSSAEEYAKTDMDYRNRFNHFKWSLVGLLNNYFGSNFTYTGKLFFPDYTPQPPETTSIVSPTSKPEQKKQTIKVKIKVKEKSSLSYITRNIFVIAALIGLGLMVGSVATMAGIMIAKGQLASKGILILIGVFFVCLLGAIIAVYTTD